MRPAASGRVCLALLRIIFKSAGQREPCDGVEPHKEPYMPPVGNTLDALLPLLQPHRPELHLNASVVEVAEPSQLAELAADPRIRRYLLARLSDTAALVDPDRAGDLETALLEAGHTPKVLAGEWQ